MALYRTGVPLPKLASLGLKTVAELAHELQSMEQALNTNLLFVSESRFEIRGEPLSWSLLFVPDSSSIVRLQELLSDST